MKGIYWKHNAPAHPDRTRAAVPLAYRRIGWRDGRAIYELDAVCDDGKARTFVSGPEGRWVKKKENEVPK